MSQTIPCQERVIAMGTITVLLLVFLTDIVSGHSQSSGVAGSKVDIHGGVPMGVSNNFCDNAKILLDVDWDSSSDYEYTCMNSDLNYNSADQLSPPVEKCVKFDDLPLPIHTCMKQSIDYPDQPPMGGPHRPLWPVYGEYTFCPPQRWVHSLEHGAVVFLYHPCAAKQEVDQFKTLLKSCMRKHVITPYRNLTVEHPLALMTYGCRLLMSHFDQEKAISFMKAHAQEAPEHRVGREGQYSLGLKFTAEIVTEYNDVEICPDWSVKPKTAEYMPEHLHLEEK